MSKKVGCVVVALAILMGAGAFARAAERKTHSVVLGAIKRVSYSKAGDPAGAAAGEDALKVRALLIDGVLKEWTTGDAHDVTDRSFVVRRAIRLNDALPSDKATDNKSHWVWQRGPWLLVDRVTDHVTALHLPDYDPGVSQISWFRDYGAYCGLTPSGKTFMPWWRRSPLANPFWPKSLRPSTRPITPTRSALRPIGNASPSALPFIPRGAMR
jgi:hypothetical protein